MFNYIKLFFLLVGTFFTLPLLAKPELYLLFHMGAGANGQFFVGGTLENRGDEEVYQGYVVITPLTEECYPLKPVLSQFGVIKAGEKYEFRIPIEGDLKGYKFDTLYATDSFANPVAVIDETAGILAGKQKAYLARCQQARE